MTEQTSDVQDLTEKLRKNPRCCPNCGGQSIQRLDKGAVIVGKRQCKDCQCFWEPPWSKTTVRFSTGAVLLALAGSIWISYLQVPAIISGEAFRRMGQASSFKEAIGEIFGPIALVGSLYCLHLCASAIRGKRGQGYVLSKGYARD